MTGCGCVNTASARNIYAQQGTCFALMHRKWLVQRMYVRKTSVNIHLPCTHAQYLWNMPSSVVHDNVAPGGGGKLFGGGLEVVGGGDPEANAGFSAMLHADA